MGPYPRPGTEFYGYDAEGPKTMLCEDLENSALRKYLEADLHGLIYVKGFCQEWLVLQPAHSGDMGLSPGPGRSHMLQSN